MKRIRYAAMSAACVLALAAGVLAQQKDEAKDYEKVPIAGKSTVGVTVAETQLLTPGWRATKLIGTDVRNDADKKVGKIDDLIISPDGNLSVAVIDVGGFIGVDTRKVAIPVRNFQKLQGDKAILAATAEELKKLPEFKYTK
jgi:sporulation protein YlmC with PRC-barrel domain